jgi:hypothetical protein
MKERRSSLLLPALAACVAWLSCFTGPARAEPLPCLPEFATASGFSLSEFESYVIQDLNGDGRDDFVTFTEPVRVYISDPGRKFRSLEAPVGAATMAGAVGDFNGDGAPDLAVGHAFPPSHECGGDFEGIAILYGDVEGGVWNEAFRDPVFQRIPGRATKMAVRDLDVDGADDLVVVTQCWSHGDQVRLEVYFGEKGEPAPFARSCFRQGRTLDGFPADLEVRFGDLDANGILDVIVWQPSWSNGLADIYFGALDGEMYSLEAPVPVDAKMTYVRYLDVTDANGDGAEDLIFWDHYLPPEAYRAEPFSLVISGKCLLGSAGRDFLAYDGPLPMLSSRQGLLGDFDGDGTDDLAWIEAGLLRFFLGSEDIVTGELSVHLATPAYMAGLFPYKVDTADFDGDGLLDFSVQSSVWYGYDEAEGIWVLYGDGVSKGAAPRLEATEALATGRRPMSLLARDLNGDALTDLAFGTPEYYEYDPELGDYVVLPACYGVFLRNAPAAGSSFSGPSFHDFGAPPYGLTQDDFCRQYGGAELHDDFGMCDPGYYTAIKTPADINGDGLQDRVMISNNSSCPTCPRVTEVYAYLEGTYRLPDLGLYQPTNSPGEVFDWSLTVADGTKGLASADFDGDGWDDFAVAGFHGNYITILYNRSPCRGYITYLRADANGDRDIDISDGVKTLLYLFLGAESSCPASMDVNGDGMLDVADPVGLFHYLFMGTAGPAPGFPLREAYRPGDPLSCQQGN